MRSECVSAFDFRFVGKDRLNINGRFSKKGDP